MNAYTTFTPTIPLRTRWEEARGTWSEKPTLRKIAAEELRKNGPSWLFCAAFDAATATDPDERAEHIAAFEQELEATEAAESEQFARQCEAYEMRTGKDWDCSPDLWAADDAMRPAHVSWGMGA